MEIIPAINTDNFDDAVAVLNSLNNVILPHGYDLARVQIDVNDGTFENIQTITPELLADLDVKYKIDYHLMVNDPFSWIERCRKGHADRVIGQVEKTGNQVQFVEKAKSLGLGVGFAIDIDTPIEAVSESLLTVLDVILMMSYPAGAGGKQLETRVFDKIEKLIEIKNKVNALFKICLDGGVTEDNIKRIKLSSVDEVAMTKKIIEGDIESNLEKFYKLMY